MTSSTPATGNGRYVTQLWLIPLLLVLSSAVFAAAASARPTTETQHCATEACHETIAARQVIHDPVAQGKCLDCHAYDNVSEHRFKPLEPDGELCATCHKAEYSAKKVVHDPVASGSCGECHDPHSSSQPALLKQSSWKLCTSCHNEMVPKPGETWSTHHPAQDNCMECHDPHASDLKHVLKQEPPDLCMSCHKNLKDLVTSSRVVHSAVHQDQSCSNCHDSHLSKLQKLEKLPQPEQCLNCHDRELQAADGRPLANMAALLKDNPEHHGPIRLGACTACHQPHAGGESNLLSAAYPPEFYAKFDPGMYKLCFTCHTPDLVLRPEPTAPTGFTDGKKNLHWLHVNQEKGRTCRACHEVHASRQPFHIRDSVPFGPGGWSVNIRFTQTSTGGACVTDCHVDRAYDHGDRPKTVAFSALLPTAQELVKREASPPVPGMAERTFPVSPPPFTPGVFPCTGCHDPERVVNTQRRVIQKPHADIQLRHDEEHRWCLDCHNAQNRDVLRSASGEPIPFSESYRLCGQCHGLQYRDWKVGVHGKRTGEWDGEKEYLLCVNCHDPHSPKFKPLTPLPPPKRPHAVK